MKCPQQRCRWLPPLARSQQPPLERRPCWGQGTPGQGRERLPGPAGRSAKALACRMSHPSGHRGVWDSRERAGSRLRRFTSCWPLTTRHLGPVSSSGNGNEPRPAWSGQALLDAETSEAWAAWGAEPGGPRAGALANLSAVALQLQEGWREAHEGCETSPSQTATAKGRRPGSRRLGDVIPVVSPRLLLL